METSESTVPYARKAGLVVQELDDETLVYDTERDKAHCLNQSAALVWKQCDGKRPITEVARSLELDPQVVWYALGQLDKYHLLQEPVTLPDELAHITRRDFVKSLGLVAAAITVPIIISITAPTPAHAGSGGASGSACTDGSQCASGICLANTCQ